MSDWKKLYEELTAFIAKNPSIELTPGIICVPADVRSEFYRLFDAVRLTIINDNFPDMLERGKNLSQQWKIIVPRAIERFKLQSIDMDHNTKYFLDDPTDGLFRLLFDPLFDVLRGKKSISIFESAVPKILSDGFARFMGQGYHSWITLSLLEMMIADELFTVKPSELDQDPSLHVEMAVPGLQEEIPKTEPAKVLSFKKTIKMSFMVPNVIAHLASPDSYVSFVPDFEFNEAKWLGRNLDATRNWVRFSELFNKFGQVDLWPTLAVYTGGYWQNVIVASDAAVIAQPDMLLELRTNKDWYDREGLASIRRHYDVLQPRLGTFVICLDEVPEAAVKELEPPENPTQKAGTLEPGTAVQTPAFAGEAAMVKLPDVVPPPPNISLLYVGFDTSKLNPVAEAILGTKTEEAKR